MRPHEDFGPLNQGAAPLIPRVGVDRGPVVYGARPGCQAEVKGAVQSKTPAFVLVLVLGKPRNGPICGPEHEHEHKYEHEMGRILARPPSVRGRAGEPPPTT